MAARLGEVLFWASCVAAMLLVAAGMVLFSGTTGANLVFYAVITLVAAALTVLAGYGSRYILAGR
jgi:hypothetical protein